jgi:hypothetical protein
MEDYFAAQAIAIAAGRKYAHSEAPKKISEASSVPREGLEALDGSDEEVMQRSKSRTQTLHTSSWGRARAVCDEAGKKDRRGW